MNRKIQIFFFTLLLIIIVFVTLEAVIRIIDPPTLRIFLRNLEYRHNIDQFNPEGFLVLDDNIGYKHAPNLDYKYLNPKHRIRTNSLGFRGIEPTPKKPGEFRIMVTGDSYTEGWGVESSETFLTQLQNQLNIRNDGKDYLVYNFGTIGYGTREEVKAVKKYFDTIEPDLVILVFYAGNDYNDNKEIRKYYLDDNRVRFQSPNKVKREQSVLYSSRLYVYIHLKLKAVMHRVKYKKALQNTREYISELDDFADQKGIKSLFIYTDTTFVRESRIKESIDRMLGMPPPHERKEILRDHCKSMNLHFIDMQNRIADAGPNLLHDKIHRHWNPEGHRYIANDIYEFMIDKLLLQSP